MKYPIVLEPEAAEYGGGFSIHFPDLPGCTSQADTLEDAIRNACEAAGLWLEDADESGELRPDPSQTVVARTGEIVLWIEAPEPLKRAA